MSLTEILDRLTSGSNTMDLSEVETLCNEGFSMMEGATPEQGCRLYDNAAWVASKRGQFERATSYAEQFLALARKDTAPSLEARGYYRRGSIARLAGDFESAIRDFGEALRLGEGNLEKGFQAKIRYDLGNAYAYSNDSENGMVQCLEAHALAKGSNDQFILAAASTTLAMLLHRATRLDDAAKYMYEALDIFRALGNRDEVARALMNIASLEGARQKDDALAYSLKKEAMLMAGGSTDFRLKMTLLTDLAEDCRNLGKFNEEKQYADELLSLAEEANSNIARLRAHFAIGKYYHELKEVAKSIEHLNQAVGLIQYAQEDEEFCIYEATANAYEVGKDIEKAYQYKKLEFESHYKITTKRYQSLKQYEAKLRNQIETNTKEMLATKEQALASSAIAIAAQTDLLANFRDELRKIVRENDEPIAALKKIKQKLKDLPCESIDWPKFEAQFAAVHPEFRAKLSQKYPELTQMEQRIAAMVRMDLKSSDIARLFCITERAVEFHRLNLRKKFHLKKGEELPKFLSAL